MNKKLKSNLMRCSALFVLLVLGSNSIQGQGRPATSEPAGDWKSQLGIGTLFKPKYQGSSDYDLWPIPYFDFEYKDSIYISPYRGIGYDAKLEGGWNYNIGLGFDFGRDEEDGDLLVGMGDIDFSGVVRAGLSYDFGPLVLGVNLSKAVTGAHDGYEIEASLGKSVFIRSWKTLLRLSLSTTFSSDEYMQTYFGVDRVQAINSGNPLYTIEGGLKEVGVSTMMVRSLNAKWSLLFLANYGKFVGDVADSPVVESSNRIFGGLFMVRSF